MEVAKIQVNGACAKVLKTEKITSGMKGATVSFLFDNSWDGFCKTVVYRCGGVTKDETIDGDTGTIPPEVLEHSNFPLKIGVYGTDAEKNVAVPTVSAEVGNVLPGADPSGDESTDPSLPVWAQLQNRIDGLVKQEDGKYLETDHTLIVRDGILGVNTTDVAEEDNTQPITSAGVHTVVGNIGAILDTI